MMRAAPPLHSAKLRAARRATEEGGVIFVVAMTLAVLAAIGAWAMQSAATEIRTAGYERQNAQTHYLSEYGAFVAMQDLSPSVGQALLSQMYCSPSTCVSTPTTGVTGTPNATLKACYRMTGAVDVAKPLLTYTNGVNTTLVAQPITPYDGDAGASTPGSLGIAPINGDFWVELSEPLQLAASAGFDGSFHTFELTLTTGGVTQQQSSNTTALYGSEGIELQRVRVRGGPFVPPVCASH